MEKPKSFRAHRTFEGNIICINGDLTDGKSRQIISRAEIKFNSNLPKPTQLEITSRRYDIATGETAGLVIAQATASLTKGFKTRFIIEQHAPESFVNAAADILRAIYYIKHPQGEYTGKMWIDEQTGIYVKDEVEWSADYPEDMSDEEVLTNIRKRKDRQLRYTKEAILNPLPEDRIEVIKYFLQS